MCQLAVFCQPLEHCKKRQDRIGCCRATRFASHSPRKSPPCLHNNTHEPKPTGDTSCRRRHQALNGVDWMPPACGHKRGLLHAQVLSACSQRLHVHHCEAHASNMQSRLHPKPIYGNTGDFKTALAAPICLTHSQPSLRSDVPGYPHRNSAGVRAVPSTKTLMYSHLARVWAATAYTSFFGGQHFTAKIARAPQAYLKALVVMQHKALPGRVQP